MKLLNKKTGKIVDCAVYCNGKFYNSVNDVFEEWEDVPESKEHWCITMYGGITRIKDNEEPVDDLKEIGNYFNSKEDVYDVLYKLKAWKRLKDKGFRLDGWTIDDGLRISICTNYKGDHIYSDSEKEIKTILDLLFGGEDDN